MGPFNPMLHFPQFGKAAWGVNVALAKNSTLPKPVHELVILVTGSRFTSRYEIYAHELVAGSAGLAASKIASLAAGGRPGDLSDEESIAFDVASVLTRGAQLPDSTYQAAKECFRGAGSRGNHLPCGLLLPHFRSAQRLRCSRSRPCRHSLSLRRTRSRP